MVNQQIDVAHIARFAPVARRGQKIARAFEQQRLNVVAVERLQNCGKLILLTLAPRQMLLINRLELDSRMDRGALGALLLRHRRQ